jgi:hypothetical protein
MNRKLILFLFGLSTFVLFVLNACSYQQGESEKDKYYRHLNEEIQQQEKKKLKVTCGFQIAAHDDFPDEFQLSPECKKLFEEEKASRVNK